MPCETCGSREPAPIHNVLGCIPPAARIAELEAATGHQFDIDDEEAF